MKKYIFLLGLLLIILSSCARVGSPNGGSKDTIPPIFLGANIDTTRTNVSTKLRELRLDFNEYIVLKDVSKNLIISPSIRKIKKILPSTLANKYILIQWDEDLKENTTYNFNFGNAIADNNEGNILPYFNFAFSTDNKIDNLYISGTVSDALLLPNKKTKHGIVVGLYKENADFRQKPYYITQADDDGYFELNYLSEGVYTIIAFEDENQNSIYDAGKEKVAFLKDKINLTQNISGLKLKLYPSKKSLKYIETKNISGGMLMLFEGNPQNVEVSSICEELKNYKISHKTKSDSVKIWIGKENNHFKKETATQLKLSYTTDKKKDTIATFYKPNPKDELNLSNDRGHLLSPKKDFTITANMDLKHINPQDWSLKSDSISQNFKAKISKTNSNEIIISSDFKTGKNYSLQIPKKSISSEYYDLEKTYIFNFEIDKPENYGSLILKIQNPPASYFWVQLINNNGKVQYSQYTNLSEIHFTEIEPASYYTRILLDSNNNGYWDEANFTEQILPEQAFIFPKEINIRKLWTIIEDWELK